MLAQTHSITHSLKKGDYNRKQTYQEGAVLREYARLIRGGIFPQICIHINLTSPTVTNKN